MYPQLALDAYTAAAVSRGGVGRPVAAFHAALGGTSRAPRQQLLALILLGLLATFAAELELPHTNSNTHVALARARAKALREQKQAADTRALPDALPTNAAASYPVDAGTAGEVEDALYASADSSSTSSAAAVPSAADLVAGRITEPPQLGRALTPRARASAAARWGGAPVVVVITQRNASLDWVAEQLPMQRVKVVVYIKGDVRTCAGLPAKLLTSGALAACYSVHNAGGREAHSMAQFVVDHYRRLPRFVYFAQDDGGDPKRMEGLSAHKNSSDAEFEAWLDAAERDPFGSTEHCLCNIVLERGNWRPGGSYGPYGTILWFMENLLDVYPLAYNLTSLRWPSNAQLLAPGWAIRTRSLATWRVFLLLLNGTTPELDPNGAPKDIVTPETRLVHDGLAMLHLAHAFERIWFAVLDRAYAPRLAALIASLPLLPPPPPPADGHALAAALQRFAAAGAARRGALRAFAVNLTASWQDGRKLPAVATAADFAMVDRDHDGRVSRDELRELMRDVLASDAESEALLTAVGAKHDAISSMLQLSWHSYLAAALKPRALHDADGSAWASALGASFATLDADGDGYLTAENLGRAANANSTAPLAAVDENGDGRVSRDEYEALLLHDDDDAPMPPAAAAGLLLRGNSGAQETGISGV